MPRWLLTLLLLFQGMAAAAEARVAAASNFLPTLRRLVPLFEEQTGHRVRLSSASSGKLYAQIRQGAPFDLFLSADRERPARLAAQGLASPEGVRTYAIGQLVLWLPTRAGDAETCRKALTGEPRLRLAVANPRTAPYGQAARQALEALGLEPENMRLVYGENIAQAFAFAASGGTDGGLVAAAQLQGGLADRGCRWPVPSRLHQPLEQAAILLRRGADNAAARDFFHFLFSREARQRIGTAGYLLP